jgi:mitochondrial import inner membrane translocase subunit TIM17
MASLLVVMDVLLAKFECILSPWVILSDFGGAFSMGAIGGGVWHGIKGARNSPRVRLWLDCIGSRLLTRIVIIVNPPQGERLVGAISTIKARAPVTGGNFGVWGGMFSTFDCAVKGWRQKEDAWNAIISGFMTGGALAARSEWSILAAPLTSCIALSPLSLQNSCF